MRQSFFEQLETRTLMSGTPLTISTATYMGGTELKILGTSAADKITVKKTSAGLVIGNTGGWNKTIAAKIKTLYIDGGANNDTITLDPTVLQNAIIYGSAGNDTITGGSGNDRIYGGAGNNVLVGAVGQDTIVSIGGNSVDTITGGTSNDSFWVDPADKITDLTSSEKNAGDVHIITSFANGASKDLLGQKLADPTVTDKSFSYKNFSTDPLFSDAGPSDNDVQQGDVGDCYFLSTLSSIAKLDPNLIKQSVVDLGDGTYAVQFDKGTSKTFERVDADLPTYSWGDLAYANTGAQNSLWAAVIEKAFTYFRSGKNSYASISSGWMSEVYTDFGKTSTADYSSANAAWLSDFIQTQLNQGKSVTYAVGKVPSGAPLIGNHAYMVDGVVTNSKGQVTAIRLRNPWGVDGAGNDGSNDGYVTITTAQAQAAIMGVSSSLV